MAAIFQPLFGISLVPVMNIRRPKRGWDMIGKNRWLFAEAVGTRKWSKNENNLF